MQKKVILVTGATGYVGGRLTARLLDAGYKVIAVGRSLSKLRSRPWAKHPNIELRVADVVADENLAQVFAGAHIVFYLVHSMNRSSKDFADSDRSAANNVRTGAEKAGVERIVYLGGLGEDSPDLSKHLRSRAEVATLLQGSKVPITNLRAGMIIGSGSASFEILRYLVQRLPVMVTPKWVDTICQPISIRNVIEYLCGCIEKPETAGRTYDIGGPDILTYRRLMQIYAEEAGLNARIIFPVPVFTPRLSSYWIHLVTPLPACIAQPLAEGLRNPVICQENNIRTAIPVTLISCRDAIRTSIQRTENQLVETHWTDAGAMPEESTIPGDPDWAGGSAYTDVREVESAAAADEVWHRIVSLGGSSGWYSATWLWKVRGLMDKLVGGVGLNRGRRHPHELACGDALDFWRVVDVQLNRRLLLFAEMKLPGKAFLEFRINELSNGKVSIQQRAIFVPSGLLGLLYWWAVTPLHDYVFSGMISAISTTTSAAGASQPG